MTTPEELGAEIGRREHDLAEMRARLEEITAAFIAAAGTHLPTVLPRIIEGLITLYPEAVERAGPTKLKKLKTGLTKLAERVPDEVAKSLSADDYWVQRGAPPKQLDYWAYSSEHFEQYSSISNSPTDRRNSKAINQALKAIISQLAPLLQACGLPLGRDRDWRSEGYGDNTTFSYAGSLNWSGEMAVGMKSYEENALKLVKQQRELEDLRQRKKQLEAKRLWDQA